MFTFHMAYTLLFITFANCFGLLFLSITMIKTTCIHTGSHVRTLESLGKQNEQINKQKNADIKINCIHFFFFVCPKQIGKHTRSCEFMFSTRRRRMLHTLDSINCYYYFANKFNQIELNDLFDVCVY